jgi:hypothetical protein
MNARPKSHAIVYVRRSTTRQAVSLSQQLEWAIGKAGELGLALDTSPEDLRFAQEQRLSCHRNLYLDDGRTGSDLKRPGFLAFIERALCDKSVSHVLIHMADRFARPELITEALAIEENLALAGLTIVFSNRTVAPRQLGKHNIGDLITACCSYNESGEFLYKLAERIVNTKTTLAKGGFWTGGRPPWGFIRILVDSQGRELQELPEGTSVRREGCHVRIKPHDFQKIEMWLLILKLRGVDHWSIKRIASHLNELGVPSPDAGRIRNEKKSGSHRVSGRWNHTTVKSLLSNRAIIAVLEFGVQSEGKYRRMGLNGPRQLDDSDRRLDGEARTVKNQPELITRTKLDFEPLASPDLFEDCQKLGKERAKNQVGIPRCADPSKYPLSSRVFDLTDQCGHPMYGRTSGNRLLYTCGRYLNSNGADCEHNQFDGEALFQFVLGFLRQLVVGSGGREAVREALMALASKEQIAQPRIVEDVLRRVEKNLIIEKDELALIERNMSRARDENELDVFRRERDTQQAKVRTIDQEREALVNQNASGRQIRRPEEEVELALALFDRIERVSNNPAARDEVRDLLDDNVLGLRIGLYFAEGIKGTKRKIRLLRSGLITTGGRPLPVLPYGKDFVPPGEGRVSGEMVSRDSRRNSPDKKPREGISFTKGNRGD